MEQERSHDRILLGSPESLYVETVTETDIKISVKQPVGGWIVGDIKPEVTSSCYKMSWVSLKKRTFLPVCDTCRLQTSRLYIVLPIRI